MKITVEHCDVSENEIVIRCPNVDEEILEILSILKSRTEKLCAWKDRENLILLLPEDILYAESVDEKTFIYCDDEVYQTAFNLGELEARYESLGYCRISKSMVVNLHKIAALRSCAAGRIEAKIKSGEKLIVSRHYAPILRNRLGL